MVAAERRITYNIRVDLCQLLSERFRWSHMTLLFHQNIWQRELDIAPNCTHLDWSGLKQGVFNHGVVAGEGTVVADSHCGNIGEIVVAFCFTIYFRESAMAVCYCQYTLGWNVFLKSLLQLNF